MCYLSNCDVLAGLIWFGGYLAFMIFWLIVCNVWWKILLVCGVMRPWNCAMGKFAVRIGLILLCGNVLLAEIWPGSFDVV